MTTTKSFIFSDCVDDAQNRISRHVKTMINKVKSTGNIDINRWKTTCRTTKITSFINSSDFSLELLLKIFIAYFVCSCIAHTNQNKMVCGVIMAICTMGYFVGGWRNGRAFATNMTMNSVKEHFLFRNAINDGRNFTILKNILFYQSHCPDIITGALVAVAVNSNKTTINTDIDEEHIKNIMTKEFKKTNNDQNEDVDHVLLMPTITTTTDTIPYHTNNNNQRSNANEYHPRNHATDNDIPSTQQMLNNDIILEPMIICEDIVDDMKQTDDSAQNNNVPMILRYNGNTEFLIDTSCSFDICVKILEYIDINITVYSPNNYDQRGYEIPNICGTMSTIYSKQTAEKEQTLDEVICTIHQGVSMFRQNMSPSAEQNEKFQDCVSSLAPLLQKYNDKALIEDELNELTEYIRRENLNTAMIDGKAPVHELCSLSIDDVEHIFKYNDKFHNDTIIILNNVEEIVDSLFQGDLVADLSDKFAVLNNQLLANGKTGLYVVQYNNHYYLNKTYAIDLDSKPIDVAVWNIDSLMPAARTIEQHRPFRIVSKFISLYQHFQPIILKALWLLNKSLEIVKRLNIKTEEYKFHAGRIFYHLFVFREFPFDLTYQRHQNLNNQLDEIASNIYEDLEDLKLEAKQKTDKTFHAENIQKYHHSLQTDTQKQLEIVILAVNLELLCNIASQETLIEILEVGWDGNVLRSIHIFNELRLIIEDATQIKRIQLALTTKALEIEDCQNYLEEALFDEISYSKDLSSVDCSHCKEFIEYIQQQLHAT